MLRFALALAAALSAVPAMAFDLSTVDTRTIHGLEGPSGARNIGAAVFGDAPLAEEGIASLAGRNLRTRFWTIEPDGIVPIHDHADRPALFVVLTGEIYEYVSDADERIRHTAGGLALEEGVLAHWWLNEGPETVHLIAFDVHRPAEDPAAVPVAPRPSAPDFPLPGAEAADHDLLGAVNIGAHSAGAWGDGRALTIHRVTLEPGGVFPSFAGPGEPVQMFLWEGTVAEHRSDADAPVTVAARTGTALDNGAAAWWENVGDGPAVLYFGGVEPLSAIEGVPRVGVLAHGTHRD